MSANELMGISQVQTTSNIKEVNANLEKGWKLLLAYTYAPNSDFPNDLMPAYSLGWPSELGEPDFTELESGGWAPDPEMPDAMG